MKDQKHYALLCAGIISVCLYWLYSAWSYDDPYITYRYAQNLVAGNGFVYNVGERILSTTSPLFAIILSIPGILISDLPRIAVFLGSISLGISGLLLWHYCNAQKMPLAGWVALFLLPLFSLPANTISSETPLYIAFILGALLSYTNKKYSVTAVLAALAAFNRPDGILISLLLGAHFLVFVKGKTPWNAVLIFIGLNILWWGGLWLYFGSPIPVTLFAKHQQGVMTISQKFAPGLLTIFRGYIRQWYFILEVCLAGAGLIYLIIKKSQGSLLIIWTLLYFACYSLLGVTRYFWYYAPLTPALFFFVGVGYYAISTNISKRFSVPPTKIFVQSVVALLMIGIVFLQVRDTYRSARRLDRRIHIYQEVGQWLDENTPVNSKVGALEIGAIGYYSRRTMIDFAGLLQPLVAMQMESDSNYQDMAEWAISQYHPEYVVLQMGVFPDLEKTTSQICVRSAFFSAADYDAPLDMAIYQCPAE